jgi:hypothetical protein
MTARLPEELERIAERCIKAQWSVPLKSDADAIRAALQSAYNAGARDGEHAGALKGARWALEKHGHVVHIGGSLLDAGPRAPVREMHGCAQEGTEVTRDQRDEWPPDTPPGTFDIHLGAPWVGHPINGIRAAGVDGFLLFVCPNGKRCGVFVGPSYREPSSKDDVRVWGWDGNAEAPTLMPSINCVAEKDGKPTGGCGWHGFIRGGVFQ